MRLLIATSHFFAPIYRRAGMHQFALSLAAKGHHVDFITVGQSRLKQFLKADTRRLVASADGAARNGRNPANIHAHVHRETFHPPSGSALVNRLTGPMAMFYGRRLDPHVAQAASAADVIIIECGYGPYYLDALQRINAKATYVAFFNDRLDLVGFRPDVCAYNQSLLPRFDLVRTNAERLLDFIPPAANGVYVPQGVDKEQIDLQAPSPFRQGSRNLVSIGDTLFDPDAMRRIAEAAASRDATVHVIGAAFDGAPSNVVVHGTLPFDRTLPFIVHADVGIAPYRPVEGADYLAQSSLKIQQYTYCGLPILLPATLGMQGENIVGYDSRSPDGVAAAVDRALGMAPMPHLRERILGWDEVGDLLLLAIEKAS